MRSIARTLERLDEARAQWSFRDDPGKGVHEFGDFALVVSDHEFKKNEIKRRYVVNYIDPDIDMALDCPITMTYDWGHMRANLEDRQRVRPEPKEREDMTKSSTQDSDLREKVRLKCKNDWDLDLTEDQISMCIVEMEEQKLSLFHNQIWPNRRKWSKKIDDGRGNVRWENKERITWDKSIDGYRAIAQRTGRFAGMDEPVFEITEDGQLIAKVTVYALDSAGTRQAYVGSAKFNEFVQLVDEYAWNDRSRKKEKTGKKVPNSQWADKPHNQLSVAAERQALRKAFQDLGGDDAPVMDAPEPALEESRGDQAPLPHEEAAGTASVAAPSPATSPKPEPKPEPKPKSKAEPEPQQPSKPRGSYVGIPRDGFRPGQMLNKSERIIMHALFKNSIHVLALDPHISPCKAYSYDCPATAGIVCFEN